MGILHLLFAPVMTINVSPTRKRGSAPNPSLARPANIPARRLHRAAGVGQIADGVLPIDGIIAQRPGR